MTRKGQHAMPASFRALMAKFHALHLATSPDRVARALGCSPEYVRRQYRDLPYIDMAAAFERARKLVEKE